METEIYKCQCNINHGEGFTFRQGEMINQSAYDKLPEKIKFKFRKISERPDLLTDVETRKLVLELRERVDKIESTLAEKQNKAKGN